MGHHQSLGLRLGLDLNKLFTKRDRRTASKHMKRGSVSLDSEEIQMKTAGRCHHTPASAAVIRTFTDTKRGEGAEEVEACALRVRCGRQTSQQHLESDTCFHVSQPPHSRPHQTGVKTRARVTVYFFAGAAEARQPNYTFIFLQFWRLEVCSQGVVRVGHSEHLSSAITRPSSESPPHVRKAGTVD